MIIQASKGCLLTQSEEVVPQERKFEKSVEVPSLSEISSWKEIPESEKDKIIAEEELFQPEDITFDYLTKVDSLMTTIKEKINDSGMSADEALAMKAYYPEWEDILGKEVITGYRFNYEGTLLEVVTPHTLSEKISPSQQPMMLDLVEVEKQPVKYYKVVEPTRQTLEEFVSESDEIKDTDNININN